MDIADIELSLAYFDPSAVKLRPPASESMIRAAEARLGVTFPPSLRRYLSWHNGGVVCSDWLIGVPPTTRHRDIVYLNGLKTSIRGADWNEAFLEVATDGCGDPYVAVLDQRDGRGECPIGFVEAIPLTLEYWVASDFLSFLWFYIEQIKHYYLPNGDLVPDRFVEIPPDFPWPFDHAWMVEHDPHLAYWLPHLPAP